MKLLTLLNYIVPSRLQATALTNLIRGNVVPRYLFISAMLADIDEGSYQEI